MKNTNLKTNDTIDGIIQINGSGSGYLINDNISKDVFIQTSKTNRALDSDIVKIKITSTKNGKLEGEVIDIIKRSKEEYVGTINVIKDLYVFTSDSVKIPTKFNITPLKTMDANDNEKVVVKIINWKEGSDRPVAKVIKILGKKGEHQTEIHSIMETFGLPYEFPDSVIEEVNNISEEITQEEIDKRLDLRDILTYTIDGWDARDLDDALSLEWVNGLVKIYVHIADVSFYVRNDSEIYKEAYSRATSVYLCDRVIPMLPEKLSNNLCSLNPNTDKLTYSFIFTFDSNGKQVDQQFCKSIINSNYRLTYDEVQTVIEGGETHSNELKSTLLTLDKYAKKLNKIRSKTEPLKINGSETKFKLDENNKPIEVIFKKQTDANRLIEEYMVHTNTKVCEFISGKNVETIHRTHGAPDINKLSGIKTFIETMGYTSDLTNTETLKNSLNGLIKQVKGTSEENIINSLITKSMQKAIYETKNNGHWGLGLTHYTHVTSPIRRIVDLKIHEKLNEILENNGYIIK